MGKQLKTLVSKIIIAIIILSEGMSGYEVKAIELPKANQCFYNAFISGQSNYENQIKAQNPIPEMENTKESQKLLSNQDNEKEPSYNFVDEYAAETTVNEVKEEGFEYEQNSTQNQVGDSGRLTYKNDGSVSTFSIINGIDVTVDKTIVEVGKETQIKVKVTQDGEPLTGAIVEIYGYKMGEINTVGEFITTILPSKSESINIIVNGVYFRDLLFALYPDQSVLEVSAEDINQQPLSDFNVVVLFDVSISRKIAAGTVLRVIVGSGLNTIVVSSLRNEYYIVDSVDALALTLNKITLSGTNTVPVNFTFEYQNNFISSGSVNVQSIDINTSNENKYIYNEHISQTDLNGNSLCYMTPGNYNISISGTNIAGEKVYLTSKNKAINAASGTINLEWDDTNTGLLNTNLLSIVNVPLDTSIRYVFSDFSFFTRKNQTIRINKDNYQLIWISIRYKENNNDIYYVFRKSFDSLENITITPYQTLQYYLDVNPKGLKVRAIPESISANNSAKIRLELLTQSDHYLYDFGINYKYDEGRSVYYSITRPDGTKEYIVFNDFNAGNYFIPKYAPFGDYVFEVQKDFGPLYGRIYPSGTLNVKGFPDANIDKVLVNLNEESTITITATQGNTPMIGAQVSLNGYNISGITDENGKFTTTFTPINRGEIGILLNGQYIKGKLFVVAPDEGVLEVTAKDKNNLPLRDFKMVTLNQNSTSSTMSNDTIGRVIALKGDNTLVFSCPGQEGYYIVQNINVIPGQINKIELDGTTTARVELYFEYNALKLKYGDLRIKNNNYCIEGREATMLQYVGPVKEDGSVIVNVTPGSYNLALGGANANYEKVFLTKENQVLDNSQSVKFFSWSELETGIIKLNLNTGTIAVNNTYMLLNEYQVNFYQGDNVRVTQGDYVLKQIGVVGKVIGSYVNYGYTKNLGLNESISVSSNTPITYNFDVNLKEMKLIAKPEIIKPGQEVILSVNAITNSDHIMVFADCDTSAIYKIVDPNNNIQTIDGYFGGTAYYIDGNAPAGLYTLEANVNLGTLYPSLTITGQFRVSGKPEITVDKNFVKLNETSDVTITVMQDGLPLAGKYVSLESDMEFFTTGYTDANGQVVLTVKPHYTGAIYIILDNEKYLNQLYAIDDNFGVINITPYDGQQNVAVNSDVVVEFNKSNISMLDMLGNVNIVDALGNGVPATSRIEGNKLIFDIANLLNYGSLYYVNIPAQSIGASDGIKLETGYRFGFITEEEKVPFTLKATNPQNNETNVLVNKKFIVTFSEEIISGVNFNQIELKTNEGIKIDAKVSIDNRSIEIIPVCDLKYALEYIIFVPDNAITNMSGTTGNGTCSINFTTETDNAAPIVIGSNPANDSSGALVDGEIVITFNENITSIVNNYQMGGKKAVKTEIVELSDVFGNKVLVKVIVEGNRLKIKPSYQLSYGTKYTLIINMNQLSDLKGNKFSENYTLSFTTQ